MQQTKNRNKFFASPAARMRNIEIEVVDAMDHDFAQLVSHMIVACVVTELSSPK